MVFRSDFYAYQTCLISTYSKCHKKTDSDFHTMSCYIIDVDYCDINTFCFCLSELLL